MRCFWEIGRMKCILSVIGDPNCLALRYTLIEPARAILVQGDMARFCSLESNAGSCQGDMPRPPTAAWS